MRSLPIFKALVLSLLFLATLACDTRPSNESDKFWDDVEFKPVTEEAKQQQRALLEGVYHEMRQIELVSNPALTRMDEVNLNYSARILSHHFEFTINVAVPVGQIVRVDMTSEIKKVYPLHKLDFYLYRKNIPVADTGQTLSALAIEARLQRTPPTASPRISSQFTLLGLNQDCDGKLLWRSLFQFPRIQFVNEWAPNQVTSCPQGVL